jgi:hypothetical protein
MGLGKRGDRESTSPRSLDELAQLRTHTAHNSPVMIAPLSINSSHADCRPERLFFSGVIARGFEPARFHVAARHTSPDLEDERQNPPRAQRETRSRTHAASSDPAAREQREQNAWREALGV